MLVAGAQRVGDLVQHGVADFVHPVQQHERPRQRDALPGVVARPEPPPRVIETECPPVEPVLLHQRSREMDGFVQIHARRVRGD